MGSGISGLYKNTRGLEAVPASLELIIGKKDVFKTYAKRRKDVDVDGYLDVIAHGTPKNITLTDVNGNHDIGHRELARLVKNRDDYKRIGIRLLSCSTGKGEESFAQHLANKLGVPVKAPTELLWVNEFGKHWVAKGKTVQGKLVSTNKYGKFKTFYPGGNKNARKQ